jgi:bis(5'-nucleosidyl)-tetraphosphatase
MKIERSAGMIVYCNANEKFLFMQGRGGDFFFFPKGHIEPEEEETATAMRELEEEMGIKDADLVEGFSYRMEYEFEKKGEQYKKFVVFFLARVDTVTVSPNEEVRDHVWLTYEELLERAKTDERFAGLEEPIAQAAEFLKR